ncbi:MAG: 2-C-methyl-D-erythritol 2,4-cyclodiphosphate synthase, partial [Bacteroidetes bacterium]|nr:2-C-methyl-D-erythritol 2,4-cyclodiphosphate synthase [Bacteroidota bacterium]
FPDTDESYKDIDSKILLQKVVLLLKESDYTIGNIDATVSLQDPKISPHIPAMQEAIANAASIDISQVSIKATTTEKLGFVGKEEGVAAQAVVLINS